MTLGYLREKTPKIIKNNPIAFGLSTVLHLLLFIFLLWEQTPEVKEQQMLLLKKNNTNDKFAEVKQQGVRVETLNTHNKKVKKTIKLNQYIISESALNEARRIKQQKIKRKKRRLRELEDQRYQKQRKINRLKVKTKKQEQAKVLAEKKRKIAQEKVKEAEKQKQAIERQRKDEAKKFKEEQKKRELIKVAELKVAQKIKVEQQKILEELKVNYIAQIASRVHNQWRYGGAKDDWSCVVDIVQDKDGNVEKVKLDSCSVDNKSKETSFKNSIMRAVNKASPLPSPPDASIFDPEIKFKFKVNE